MSNAFAMIRLVVFLPLCLLLPTADGLLQAPCLFHPIVTSPTERSRPSTCLSASLSLPVESKKRKKRSQSKRSEEFQWLNWLYTECKRTEPGKLDELVLKRLVPAISSWGRRKSPKAANRAEEFLERIIAENLAGNKKAGVTVNLFNAAMDGHAKVGNPAGVQRILRRMEHLRKKHESLAHLKPDVFSMSTLVTAWAKSRSPDAPAKAEAILNYMELNDLSPNTITYNSVLHAMAVGDQIDKAVKAEDFVKHMRLRHLKGEDCQPDIYSYQLLIQAWSTTSVPGAPQKAERILRLLDNEAEKGNKALAPNSHCFTSTIHAWARSSERNRARNAYQLLNHMRKRHLERGEKGLKPNVVPFTAVLNACARPVDPSEREAAFEIAELTMTELSLGTFDNPNFLTYAAYLSVCSSTLAPGQKRDDVVRETFTQCQSDGQVAQIVLEKLKIASPTLYDELEAKYLDEPSGYLCLPTEWTSKIRGERTTTTTTSDKSDSATKDSVTVEKIPHKTKARLEAVEKFGGKSGIYSSGDTVEPEDLGIQWSQRPLGADE